MIENILYPTEKIKFHVCTYVYAMISIVQILYSQQSRTSQDSRGKRRLQLVQTGHIHLETCHRHNICNIQDTLPLTHPAQSSLAFMPYTKFPSTNQCGINQRVLEKVGISRQPATEVCPGHQRQWRCRPEEMPNADAGHIQQQQHTVGCHL